jgi:hypothetical protein
MHVRIEVRRVVLSAEGVGPEIGEARDQPRDEQSVDEKDSGENESLAVSRRETLWFRG